MENIEKCKTAARLNLNSSTPHLTLTRSLFRITSNSGLILIPFLLYNSECLSSYCISQRQYFYQNDKVLSWLVSYPNLWIIFRYASRYTNLLSWRTISSWSFSLPLHLAFNLNLEDLLISTLHSYFLVYF